VHLRVRHRPALEPAVEHVVHPPERREVRAAGGRDLEAVDELAVKIGDLDAAADLFLELRHAADHDHLLAVGRRPHGQGGAPEARAGDGPVVRALEPRVEALFLHVRGDPARLGVAREQAVLDLFHRHKPAGHGAVDQGGVAAPAEGVAVREDADLDEAAEALDGLDDLLVGVLDVPVFFVFLRVFLF